MLSADRRAAERDKDEKKASRETGGNSGDAQRSPAEHVFWQGTQGKHQISLFDSEPERCSCLKHLVSLSIHVRI